MAKPEKIGVVTVTYNSGRVIDDFIASLFKQRHRDFVVFVVDNASSDDTLERVRRCNDARLVVICNRSNGGVGQGNNQGIRASLDLGCDAILLINNDTVFEPDLLENLGKGIDDLRCDMIAPKIVFFDNPQKIWYAGGHFNRRRAYMAVQEGEGQADSDRFDTIRQVEYAPTCCVLIRRNVFETIGLMDERYFAYCDDVDFCFRAKRAGLKLFYLPTAKLLHKVSSLTGGTESEFSMRYGTRNRVRFVRKNLGWLQLLYFLSAYQIYLLVRLVFGPDDIRKFALKERSLVEGLRA